MIVLLLISIDDSPAPFFPLPKPTYVLRLPVLTYLYRAAGFVHYLVVVVRATEINFQDFSSMVN